MSPAPLRIFPRGPACDLEYRQDLARDILLRLLGRREFDHYLFTEPEQKKLVELSVQLAQEFMAQTAG